MSSFLSQLEWREATKGFDPSKQVNESDLNKILNSIRMAPTSFGLQPFHVDVVKDKALREKLQPHAWHQKQVTTCSALLVFIAHEDVAARIDQFFQIMSGGNAEVRAKMKDYEGMMRGSLTGLSALERRSWATRQIYIALGFAMAACAELSIDSCAMEGFVGPEFDKLLNLPEGQHTAVLLPVGYRDLSIKSKAKFRFPESDLFKYK
jgi:nitroreductase